MRRGLALALLGAAGVPAAADETPYLYQRTGTEAPRRVEVEGAVGSREARPWGGRGVETAVRLEASPLPWLTLEARGGLLTEGGETRAAVSAGLLGRVGLGPVVLHAGAGYARDYQDVDLLQLRLLGTLNRGRLGITASSLVEVPFAEGRDAVDLILGAAISYAVTPRLRLGAEALGEDLEAAWEEDEAEGGARLLVGPTAWMSLSPSVDLKLGGALTATAGGTGVLGRAAVGLRF